MPTKLTTKIQLPRPGSPLREILESLAERPAAIPPYHRSGVKDDTRHAVARYCNPWREGEPYAGGPTSPPYDHVYVLDDEVKRRLVATRRRKEV